MWRFKASSSEECLYWLQSVSQLWSGLQSADASVMSWDDDENDNDEVALLGPQKEKAALIPRDPEP